MFLKKKHWRISFWLIFIMLFQLIIPIGQIAFAGGPVYINTLKKHKFGGEGTEEKPYESRLWPDAAHEDYGHRGTAQFKVKLSDGREILSPRESRESVGVGVITRTATDWSGAEYTAELGTGIQFENLSTGSPLGGSKGLHFQWYAPDGRSGVFSLNITQQGPMNSPKFPTVLDAVGEWRFYMFHYSSKGYPSANGNHFSAGRGSLDPDSKWYNTYFKQYFTAVKITVMPQNPQDPPDPPSGNIIQDPPDPPSGDTPAPTETYDSESGLYYLDKTKPYYAEFSWDYRDYIDEDLTVEVTVGDNLSGVVETRYVLNNSPYDTSGMRSVSASTAEGQLDYDTFTVHITEPGSWWIHVYQRDRAGNVTWTTSPEYKIVRLGHSNNRNGETFTEQSDKLWISPLQMKHKNISVSTNSTKASIRKRIHCPKASLPVHYLYYGIPRATRFDTMLKTYGLADWEANYTTVHLTVPKWTDDEVEKKINGQYAITEGITDTHTMNYYSGYAEGPQGYATPSTILQWWKAYIAPYGTPVTLDRDGYRLRPKYEFKVQLKVDHYYPNKTHVSTIKFDIIPETKVKTEIIKNEY